MKFPNSLEAIPFYFISWFRRLWVIIRN